MGEALENGPLRLAHEAAARNGGVGGGKESQAPVPDGEIEDVEHDGGIERPHRPELPVGQAAPAGEHQTAPPPGRQRQHDANQEVDERRREKQGGPGQDPVAPEPVHHLVPESGGEADQQRGPDAGREEEPEDEGPRSGMEDAGRDIGRLRCLKVLRSIELIDEVRPRKIDARRQEGRQHGQRRDQNKTSFPGIGRLYSFSCL